MSRMPSADENVTPGLGAALSEIVSTRGWVSNALRALSHAPEGLRRFAALGEYVRFQTSLPGRIRELTVITIARGCDYAWTHHSAFARRAGVTEDEIAAVKEGRIPETASAAECLALGYVHAFLAGGKVTDQEFNDLLAALGPRAVTDLTLLAGYFLTLGWILNTYEIDLEPRDVLEKYWRGGGRAKLA